MQRALTRATAKAPISAAARLRPTQQLRFAHKVHMIGDLGIWDTNSGVANTGDYVGYQVRC